MHQQTPADARRGRVLGDLRREERFVLVALRAWPAGRHVHGGPAPAWRDLFSLEGIAPAGALGFDLLLSVLTRRALQPPRIGDCACARLDPDEEIFQALAGTLQRGDLFGSVGALCTWLPDTALLPALRGGQSFAEQLLAAGLVLPGAAGGPEFATNA